jgi:adenine-specific DNA-methyltransferase
MRGDWWSGFHLDMGNVPKEGGVLLLNGKKPVRLIKQLIEFVGDENATILDFFAGSGTTGQAVLELNKNDAGTRKFILCTNDEGNICTEICYPRLQNVIKGESKQKKLDGNLKYFKTAFVSKSNVSDDTRNSLVRKSVEMICVREDTFDKVVEQNGYKLYRDNKHVTGILYNLDEIEIFKRELEKLLIPAHIYVFSLTNDTYTSDFEDLKVSHKLCPIPESILEVYRKLFRE